ncbi:MAG: CheR family methyltransferase [Coriobacteriia bacterium]|nr:CheR family methyltransferase [Coriobacteriia bacterium]
MPNEEALRKDLTPSEFQLFRDWIHQHSGIFLEESKMDSLRISLVTRATRFSFTDYRDYFRLLSADEDEFKELMNLVTINETSFFRFPAQFDALRDTVIPEILDARPISSSRQFRVWSAGCSTGEEPYTLSMTLLESCLEGLGYNFEVVGTDVSTQALERARKAVYPARTLTSLNQSVLQRWFEPTPDGQRPVKRVRDRCSFHYHNLIKEPYPLALMSNWDIIFCRNVTIYFRVESTRRVVDHFFDALNPGGYLFIGHSETLTSISDRFEPVEIGGVFLYRKPEIKRALSFDDVVARRQGRTGVRREDPASHPAGVRPARVRRYQPKPEPEPEESVAEVLIAEAKAKLEQASAADALVLATQAIQADPENTEAHLMAAFAYADLGKLDEAMEQAETVLETYPLTAGARYIKGIIYQQRGQVDLAIAEFKRTIYIDSDFVLAHFAIANLQRQQGNLADACREYENTLKSLYAKPEGSWTAFLGGFRSDLLARSCERSLIECGRSG